MAIWSSYALKVNWNVALVSLDNVEDVMFTACGLYIHPTNPPINRLPIRKVAQDGVERGSGKIPHVWNFVLPLAAIQHWITTYFIVSGLAVAAREMTVNTLDIEKSTPSSPVFSRWNARVFRPVPGTDYEYDPVDQLTMDFRQRMLLITEL